MTPFNTVHARPESCGLIFFSAIDTPTVRQWHGLYSLRDGKFFVVVYLE